MFSILLLFLLDLFWIFKITLLGMQQYTLWWAHHNKSFTFVQLDVQEDIALQ